jgi:hypothetical protein
VWWELPGIITNKVLIHYQRTWRSIEEVKLTSCLWWTVLCGCQHFSFLTSSWSKPCKPWLFLQPLRPQVNWHLEFFPCFCFSFLTLTLLLSHFYIIKLNKNKPMKRKVNNIRKWKNKKLSRKAKREGWKGLSSQMWNLLCVEFLQRPHPWKGWEGRRMSSEKWRGDTVPK